MSTMGALEAERARLDNSAMVCFPKFIDKVKEAASFGREQNEVS